jgi:uncharacterized protein YjbI with pentapeptide repeats
MSEIRETSGKGRWVWVVVVAGVVILGAGAGAWWLVDPLAAATPADRASALQATFTLAFGFGGVATLALFARRQWLQERMHEHDRQVAADTRHDAEQRRITEQYIKAVEQLGHENPSVRLGGLYALDRLGRNHVDQRQVVVDVWCAYLRRRYQPARAVLMGTESDPIAVATGEEDRENEAEAAAIDEYEVRATAQRLLARHLRDPRPPEDRDGSFPSASEEFWDLRHVDLTKATLVRMDFRDCVFPKLDADGLRCHRRARFDRAVFKDRVFFQRSTFFGTASFEHARFADAATFFGATFHDRASFKRATFEGDAGFERVEYCDAFVMAGARFEAGVNFADIRCHEDQVPEDLEDATASILDDGSTQRTWPPGWTTVVPSYSDRRRIHRYDRRMLLLRHVPAEPGQQVHRKPRPRRAAGDPVVTDEASE